MEAIEWHEEEAKIANEIGNRAAQGFESQNLGYAYHGLNKFQKAIQFHQKEIKIFRK